MGTRVYVGNLPVGILESELEEEFARFGPLKSLWVARKPPGFAFIEYSDERDADDAVRRMDGARGWRVEFSRRGAGGGGRGGGRYYNGGGGRDRSPDNYRRRHSPSYDRYRDSPRRRRSPSYDKHAREDRGRYRGSPSGGGYRSHSHGRDRSPSHGRRRYRSRDRSRDRSASRERSKTPTRMRERSRERSREVSNSPPPRSVDRSYEANGQ
eukprot:evm.model.scf_1664.1 EVM.evm.TU.scf_1664.1   scf_1664:20631-24326(-)